MTKAELCGQRQEVRDLFLNRAIITRIKLTHLEHACKLNLLILLLYEHILTSKRLRDFVGFCQPTKLVSTLLQKNYQETIKAPGNKGSLSAGKSRLDQLESIGIHQ